MKKHGKMFGYNGKILRIDLTKKKISSESLDKKEVIDYIGGRGIGIKKLYENKRKIDPLSPENILIFMTGPLTGFTPFSAFYNLTTKSPLTGTCLSSHSGGLFGPELKFSGFDGIIIKGKSDKPCYILIDNEVEIRDASDLWGKDCKETTDILEKEHRGKVVCIGQGGENLVRFASLMNDRDRALGRGGAGAVCGSKNLKAIVVRRNKKIDTFMEIGDEFKKALEIVRVKSKNLKKYGTSSVIDITNSLGVLPTRNFNDGEFEYAESINGDSLLKNLVKKKACFLCPIGCSNVTKTDNIITEGPEYETLCSFGSNIGNSDIKAIIRANDLCNRFGLDTISCGNTIAFAMELSEKRMIDEKIEWGVMDTVFSLIEKIAKREGIGDLLSQGTKRVSEKVGGKEFAMHVKGMEFPAYDPRGSIGMALSYAISNRGACHLRSSAYAYELFTSEHDRFSYEKSKLVKELQEIMAVVDSLLLCKFGARSAYGNSFEEFERLLKMATGMDFNTSKIGERIIKLERLYNFEEGLSIKDDTLPERFFTEETSRGYVIDKTKFKKMLDEYYKLCSWKDGKPIKKLR